MVDMNTWFGIQQLYADYASAVDSGHWDLWPNSSPRNASTSYSHEKTMSVAFRCAPCC